MTAVPSSSPATNARRLREGASATRQSSTTNYFWIAPQSPSSGAHTRDPLARDDGITQGFQPSRVLAVAMLVFLARAARTILVAADLAPCRRILRIAVGGRSGHQRGVGERHFVFAGVGIQLVGFHLRQRRLLIFRRNDFHTH